MKIKVCGMKYPSNIKALQSLDIDYIGFIFYAKSPRYIDNLDGLSPDNLFDTVDRVGVFVNSPHAIIREKIEEYGLSCVQLHGKETREDCSQIKHTFPNVKLIKAFSIENKEDFTAVKEYVGVCDYFLFDTKTKQYGGSGLKFDWKLLNSYEENIPFFLSGGISIDDITELREIEHPQLYALDLNSRFEVEPGLKNIQLLENFINEIRNEQN